MAKHNQVTGITHKYHSYKAWVVWGLGCLFYFYEFLLQVSPNVMSNELMHDFAITSRVLGIIVGLYLYSYAAMQIPAGVLMDYFGPRRLLTIATLICAISTICFGMTHSILMASAARFMIGLGSAFAAVGTMKLAASWFKAERFALLTGIMVTIGTLGAIGGQAPLAMFVDAVGWRQSLIIMGCIGIVIAILIFIITTDFHGEETVTEEPIIASLRVLLKNKQLWLIALYGGLVYMATPVLCGLWGVPFLMLKMHIAKATAANYISFILIGWAIASPLWGIFSNQIGRRKPTLYIAAIGALCTSAIFIFAPIKTSFNMQAILFLFGIFSAAFLPAFAVAKELCNKNYVATGLSFMNMINMLGAAIAEPVIGFLLDQFWTGGSVDHMRVYSLETYHYALAFLPLSMLLAILILPYIQETYCKEQA